MRQFKINNELINKIKKLIKLNDKDKLIINIEELNYADIAEIFEFLEINSGLILLILKRIC